MTARTLSYSIVFLMFVSGCPGTDTQDAGQTADAGAAAPQACGAEGDDECADGYQCNGQFCETEDALLDCSEGEACPAGSSCVEDVCTQDDDFMAPAPQACVVDSEVPAEQCGASYECVNDICVYGSEGVACTIEAAETCGEGGFCAFLIGDSCGEGGVSGECTTNFIDALSADFAPVCGCDGETYWNADEAVHAGVAVEDYGYCPEPG